MTPEPDLGQRPHPNTLPCSDCGHVWFEGERRHHYVGGSGEDSIEDGAEIVCTLCKQQRFRPRDPDAGRFIW